MNLVLTLVLLAQVEPIVLVSQKTTPDMLKDVDRLNAIRQEAFDQAVKLLGAKLPEKWKVALEVVDGADPDPLKFKRHSGLTAETTSDSATVARIKIYSEYFINGIGRMESTFRHEMIHAVMRLDLPRDKYGKIPKWLREGIAVCGSNQVTEKLWDELSQAKVAAEPEKMVDGLEDSDHNLSDYFEDGVAVSLLKDKFPAIESVLREGRTYQEAVEAATGEKFDAFVAKAKERAIEEVRKVVAEHKDAIDLFVQIAKKNAESGAECERFLAVYPKSPLKSAVLYYRAKAAKDEGLPRFEEFIQSANEPFGKSTLVDDATLWKARLLLKKGKKSEAIEQYEYFLRWHVGSSAAIDALYEWGLVDKERGTAILKHALELDPNHKLAARAKKAIGE